MTNEQFMERLQTYALSAVVLWILLFELFCDELHLSLSLFERDAILAFLVCRR